MVWSCLTCAAAQQELSRRALLYRTHCAVYRHYRVVHRAQSSACCHYQLVHLAQHTYSASSRGVIWQERVAPVLDEPARGKKPPQCCQGKWMYTYTHANLHATTEPLLHSAPSAKRGASWSQAWPQRWLHSARPRTQVRTEGGSRGVRRMLSCVQSGGSPQNPGNGAGFHPHSIAPPPPALCRPTPSRLTCSCWQWCELQSWPLVGLDYRGWEHGQLFITWALF